MLEYDEYLEASVCVCACVCVSRACVNMYQCVSLPTLHTHAWRLPMQDTNSLMVDVCVCVCVVCMQLMNDMLMHHISRPETSSKAKVSTVHSATAVF